MSGVWPFHDKTHLYFVWGLAISWKHRLILCLGLDNFMTKQTDTMSGPWTFHDKTHFYYVWGLTISWQNGFILWLGLDHFMTKQTETILGFDHFMKKQTDTMSGAWTFHDRTEWYYVWGFNISWENKLILCLRFGHIIIKHIYTVWALTISWQNRLTLYLGIDHFIKKQSDSISEFWPFHDKID
jgi:hypothetical protein